jgi:adenylate kinase
MKLLFLGPPGAGKGTQAERVAEALGIAHVSTGAMFRQHVAGETELGLRVKAIMASGDLVPDEVTIAMLNDRIGQPDAAAGFILDGFPRTLPQAEALDDDLGADALDAVVVLEVPDEELIERMLSRGREDDTHEIVANRLKVYAADTEPLIGFYRERGIVVTVSGVGEIDEITQRIMSALER